MVLIHCALHLQADCFVSSEAFKALTGHSATGRAQASLTIWQWIKAIQKQHEQNLKQPVPGPLPPPPPPALLMKLQEHLTLASSSQPNTPESNEPYTELVPYYTQVGPQAVSWHA